MIHKPKFRKANKRYNLDNYSSKGSTVKSQRKVHHMMLLQQDQQGTESKVSYVMIHVCLGNNQEEASV